MLIKNKQEYKNRNYKLFNKNECSLMTKSQGWGRHTLDLSWKTESWVSGFPCVGTAGMNQALVPLVTITRWFKRQIVTRKQDFITSGDGGYFEMESFIFEIFIQ